MMNKKGEEEEGLLGNALGTVLAVTATVIIIYFIYLALTAVWSDSELKAAGQIADTLEEKINAIENGQSTKVIVQGSENLDGWHIKGWSKTDQDRPDKCFFSSCLCICKGKTENDCQENGLCRELEKEAIEVWHKKATKQVAGVGRTVQETGWYHERSSPEIPIAPNFMILNVTKSEKGIEILLYDQSYLENINKILPK